MKNWRFENYQSGVLLMHEYEEDSNHFRYLVQYPNMNTSNDIYYTEWDFKREEINSCSSCEWELDDKEKEEIKNYIRKVIKPKDYCEYEFKQHYDDGFIVKSIYDDAPYCYTDYIVFFPTKEDRNEWYFAIHISNNDNFTTKDWDISDTEAEYLKDYIRNKLKPRNLCESEEKEMENTILNVSVPSDVAEEVMSIISRYEGVPVGNSLQNVTDEFEQTKALTVSEYYRLKDVMIDKTEELEQCEEDKKIVLDERNNTRLKAKNCINDIFTYLKNEEQNEILEALIANMSDDVISCFDLESWREKKYDVVEIEVEMTKRKTIKVVVPHENYSECIIDDYIKNCSGLNDTFYYEEAEYEFDCHNSYDSGLTSKQICQEYPLSELFPGTSEIEDEVF